MGHFLLCVFLSTNVVDDSVIPVKTPVKESYTKKALFNGILGVGFTVGAVFYHKNADKAYDEYKTSRSIKSALENWQKMSFYEGVRNVCAAGALLFIGRALYYQIKQIKKSKASSLVPALEFKYLCQNKWSLGIIKEL
ncbi:MAG TPA: hypothetical protein ENI34_05000 [candidate division WOR-3 bacterium]|uniref:Uncharacterized protein n=1 Tax=candidate division WOR-3 bacterium TaxID=2052148 RepID=A0A9C9EM37_UNCW3|nr:hypothetical protein [candidate division WOR-3 bacterium]